jgi:hypothetical protein
MCIIAAIPSGKPISKATLKTCWDNNPHGGGFMYSDNGRVITYKEMHSFKNYWKEFCKARLLFNKSAFVCHFRISTHGKINEENCHPFIVDKSLGFAHNGIIYSAPKSNDYSDTYMFNEVILKKLPQGFLGNPSIMSLVKNYIGNGSKLAFLSGAGVISIVNEKAGVWDGGVWYSNTGYKRVDYYDYGGTKLENAPKGKPLSLFDECAIPVKKKYSTCDYCPSTLFTSQEIINGCCQGCYNQILDEDISESIWSKY